MGKIKKSIGINGFSPKEKVQKRHSMLTTTEKTNSPKNRRKSMGTALSTPLKQFKAEKIPKSTSKSAKSPKPLILNTKKIETNVQSTPKPPKIAKQTPNVQDELRRIVEINDLNLDEATIKSGIKALFKLVEAKKNEKNALLEDSSAVFLQISTVKIASCPVRTLRLPLQHPLVNDSSEICLIVSDIPGNLKKDHDKAVEHYENILKQHGITNIKKIMPYHELKTEHDQYELKRKLVELYDAFLVEGKISGYVVKHCGKIFQQKRKLPIPVKLHVPKLRKHLDNALSKTPIHIHPHGDNFVVQIAHTDMDEDAIFDNVVSICLALKRDFPGGWTNVKGLNVKAAQTMSVPIYYTLRNPSDVDVPVVKSKRPKAFKEVTGELSTLLGANVTVLPGGDVILDKQRDSGDSDDDTTGNSTGLTARKRRASKKKRNVSVASDEAVRGNDSDVEPSSKTSRKNAKGDERLTSVEKSAPNKKNSPLHIFNKKKTLRKPDGKEANLVKMKANARKNKG